MTQEEKQLLLKDLCGRLPYGVKVRYPGGVIEVLWSITNDLAINDDNFLYGTIKPYLRPMSSMTDEEKQEYVVAWDSRQPYLPTEAMDWLNARHFDYRGLIPMGLALEAPEGMYEIA